MVVVQQPRTNSGAIIAEVILGLFGIYGVGWLIAKETNIGITLLICSVVWWVLAFLLIVFTIGFGALCVVPIDIAALVTSAVLLSKRPVRA